MYRVSLFLLFSNAVVLFSQSISKDEDRLYVASYNIYTLGKNTQHGQAYNNAVILAEARFDLIAVQEVMGEEGEQELGQIIRYLNDSFNLTYAYLVSTNIGQGFGGQERIGFIYDPDRILPLEGENGEFVQIIEVEGGRDFAFSYWQSGDFDFVFGSGHLIYGSNDDETLLKRSKELQQALDLFEDPLSYFGDEDLIFVGDFNRAGMVNAYQKVSYDTTKLFIPNIEFFDPDLNRVGQVKKKHIKNKDVPSNNPQLVSTTVAKNTYVYDMIICSTTLLDEFGQNREEGAFQKSFGIISFDEADGIGTIAAAAAITSHHELKSKYSDHRPLWVSFRL